MIKLKNVSKFYYSKGVIASGFSKINLEFNIGEIVAITGESGSGKSTLLNVLSGLDSYEEGEMYINGLETSHYTEKDFEDYRRKYIGNIFQDFNLINSYTVYQNIELVLLLNGDKKRDIKNEVNELIKKVGLTSFRNTKVSKLSGGQKQRVAIARALAKDTPIIIADEPTGNLDAKSSANIIKLLSEIAKDKLVIIVTHNYDQVENYVTRKIKMHDGKILEDEVKKDYNIVKLDKDLEYKNITILNRFRLGIRNTFNIIPKFMLLFAVFFFIVAAMLSEYSSFKKEERNLLNSGDNQYYQNKLDTRIIINKMDGTVIKEDDYSKINDLGNIDYIIKNDLILDDSYFLTNKGDLSLYGMLNDYNSFVGELDSGRMPTNEFEIVVYLSKFENNSQLELNQLLTLGIMYNDFNSIEVKVVGIKYGNDNDYGRNDFYVSQKLIDTLLPKYVEHNSTFELVFKSNGYNLNSFDRYYSLMGTSLVNKGEIYIPNEINNVCTDNNCLNQEVSFTTSNLYKSDTLNLKVTNLLDSLNFNSLLKSSDVYISNNIYINDEDYNLLYNYNYQSSVFVTDYSLINKTSSQLNELGFNTNVLSSNLLSGTYIAIIKIFKTIITGVLFIALLFISYFVIKVILKSRNTYYSTIRMLGANKVVAKELLIIDLVVVANIAYFVFIIIGYLSYNNYINITFAKTTFTYLHIGDYIFMYLLITLMSFLLSIRYSKKLFKNSAMKTLREEV